MHSPANIGATRSVGRERAEFALRIMALGALVVGVLQVAGTLSASSESHLPALFTVRGGAATSQETLRDMIKRQLISETTPRPLHIVASVVPNDTARALMTAAKDAGVPVRWTDSSSASAIALEATSVVDPIGGVLLRAAAPPGTALAFRDSVGLIDTVQTRSNGASIMLGHASGSVRVSSPHSYASATAPAPVTVRGILVLANPGWEAKFTTAALEERGWKVDVRYSLGRNVTVTQGDPLRPDTARYAVVVALDSAALPHVEQLRRYAAMGGGVVIAGIAGTLREFGDMLPGKAGAEQAGIPGSLATDTPLEGVSWRPITPDSNAIVLREANNRPSNVVMSVEALAERAEKASVSKTSANADDSASRRAGADTTNVISRSTHNATTNAEPTRNSAPVAGGATVVARRYGAGRVVMVAYDALWQWRMAGPDGSVEAHRKWWSNIVSLVAFAPDAADATVSVETNRPGNAASYADLAARLGPPSTIPVAHASAVPERRWEWLIIVTAAVALVLEWASRRLRGAR